jgi:hypothetical protein
MEDRRLLRRDSDVPKRTPAIGSPPLEAVPLDAALGGRALAGRGGEVAFARLAIRLGRVAGNQAVARHMTARPSSRPVLARVYGRGATSFVAGNTTEADRARNRRVVITVREPAAP